MLRLFRGRMILATAIAATAAFAVACGGDDSGASSTATTVPTAIPTQESAATVVSTEEPTTIATSTSVPVSVTGDADAGEKLFNTKGCSACHNTSSKKLVGPGLAGISDRGDDDYIRESLSDPGAVIVEGYNNVMTDFSNLSEQEVDDLIAFLHTLS